MADVEAEEPPPSMAQPTPGTTAPGTTTTSSRWSWRADLAVGRGRHPPARDGHRRRRHLDRVQRPLGRRLPHRPQHVEPVGPEHVHRHHGHGHGARHRVAEHRPVGRVRCSASSATSWRSSRPTASSPSSTSASASGASATAVGSGWSRSPSGIALGALVGGVQGFIIAYGGVPAFIVTLGGFLVWRGMIFRTGGKKGQTLAPLNDTFQLFGGGPDGVARRVEELAVRGRRVRAHRPRPRPRPAPPAAPRPAAAAAVDGRHVRRRRVRRRAGRRRARGEQLHLADHRGPDRDRVPRRDPDRASRC